VVLPDLSVNGSDGAVLVADTGNHRVLVFATSSPDPGASADVVLGQADLTSALPDVSVAGLSSPAATDADPLTQRIYVADSSAHRVMTYDASSGLSNGASGTAIGQATGMEGEPNRGGAPGPGTLSSPGGVTAQGGTLVVADSGNHRILIYGGSELPTDHRDATLVLGQRTFGTGWRNGKRLASPSDVLVVEGQLVVADTANHRVVIYGDVPRSGDPEPVRVLGQQDPYGTLPNRGGVPSAATMRFPTSLATDGTRLLVSDSGNHRVLIWSSLPDTDGAPADLILGQPTEDVSSPNAGALATARTLDSPRGLSTRGDWVAVADSRNHRVLLFGPLDQLVGYDRAIEVYGQSTFVGVEANQGLPAPDSFTLRHPEAVRFSRDRVYAADAGNHRVLAWTGPPAVNNPVASGLLGQGSFDGAAVAPAAPETLFAPSGIGLAAAGVPLVVADTAHHRVVFYDDARGETAGRRSLRVALGQADPYGGEPNRGSPEPGLGGLSSPRGLFWNGYDLIVADTGNGRVVLYR
jgi:hypothetical protein